MAHTLVRSREDRMLGGVCGGLGRYFDVDPNLVRLVFVVLAVVPGIGIPIYVILWLILPEEGEPTDRPLADRVRDGTDDIVQRAQKVHDDVRATARAPNRAAIVALGVLLIALGIVFLLRNLGITWLHWFALGTLWPVLLILIGTAFLWRWLRGGE